MRALVATMRELFHAIHGIPQARDAQPFDGRKFYAVLDVTAPALAPSGE